MTTYPPIDLNIFPPEREKRLREVYRFSLFEIALYRSNLWEHEHRVCWLVEEIAPLLTPHLVFDPEKVRTLALVHDDAEIITGDAQAGQKTQMSKEELTALEQAEEQAINELAVQYPKEINGYFYQGLLNKALHKDTIEAQLTSYADKFDAYGETMHEILAGNIMVTTSSIFYAHFFAQVRERLPLLAKARDAVEKFSFIYPFIVSPPIGEQITVERYAGFSGKPHTKESVARDTEYFLCYDAWKRMVIKKGNEEGKSWLLDQREFLPA